MCGSVNYAINLLKDPLMLSKFNKKEEYSPQGLELAVKLF
jgi:hypothetical protein